jgi:hypothetical protein
MSEKEVLRPGEGPRKMLELSGETPLALLVNAALTQFIDGNRPAIDMHIDIGSNAGDFKVHVHVCVARVGTPSMH